MARARDYLKADVPQRPAYGPCVVHRLLELVVGGQIAAQLDFWVAERLKFYC
jgi:hypothetical protein